MKRSLVIVGNGMATGRLLDEIIKRGQDTFSVTVIGDELHGGYNRIMLSPVLAGEVSSNDIINKPVSWYKERGINFVGGSRVCCINRQEKWVKTEAGYTIDYDELVLATGSRPAKIPAENQALQHIYSFRTLDDVDRILCSARNGLSETTAADIDPFHALVIGGGLLGLEAAYGLACKGLAVTLVHRSGWLMNRQLDDAAGAYLKALMELKNVRFRLSSEVQSFVGESRVTGARFKDGSVLPCSLVIVATGITPNKELGLNAGLAGTRGVDVDEFMRTSDPFISAVGECIEFRGATFGLVEPIWSHCISLADRLCLQQSTPFVDSPSATKLKVSGVDLFSAGDSAATEEHRVLAYEDRDIGVYRKILLADNKIVGIVLLGDTRDGHEYFALMKKQVDVADIAPMLLMGRAFYQSQNNSLAA